MIATQPSHPLNFTLDSIDIVAAHAAVAFDSLQSTFFSSNVTGEWDACSAAACGSNCHWQTANAFEAVANFGGKIADGHHPDFDAISEAVFAAASMVPTPEEPGVQNVFQWGKYDDIMWWALALLQARDSTDNRQVSLQFLETATAIWHKVVLVWDNVCVVGFTGMIRLHTRTLSRTSYFYPRPQLCIGQHKMQPIWTGREKKWPGFGNLAS